jgi:hypothetical protein
MRARHRKARQCFNLPAPPFFTLVFAITLELRVADAAAVSGDLSLPEFCADCAPLLDDSLKTEINSATSIDDKIQSLSRCGYYDEPDCGSFEQIFTTETTTVILKLINDHLGSETLASTIPIEYQGEYQGNSGCSYFETKLRDQSRVRAECDNIEPGSNHEELVSVLTLTIVSVVAFALLAGVWLLHRLFRNWRLQSLIPHDKRASDLQIHNGRRHPANR